jgi:hypothetical protein
VSINRTSYVTSRQDQPSPFGQPLGGHGDTYGEIVRVIHLANQGVAWATDAVAGRLSKEIRNRPRLKSMVIV